MSSLCVCLPSLHAKRFCDWRPFLDDESSTVFLGQGEEICKSQEWTQLRQSSSAAVSSTWAFYQCSIEGKGSSWSQSRALLSLLDFCLPDGKSFARKESHERGLGIISAVSLTWFMPSFFYLEIPHQICPLFGRTTSPAEHCCVQKSIWGL